MSEEYPIWCVDPNCGIDDCDECPFSPWNLRQQQKELNKKIEKLEHRREVIAQDHNERLKKLEQDMICMTTGSGLQDHDIEELQEQIKKLEQGFDKFEELRKSLGWYIQFIQKWKFKWFITLRKELKQNKQEIVSLKELIGQHIFETQDQIDSLKERLEKLEQHDIFRIWSSVRTWWKTTIRFDQ